MADTRPDIVVFKGVKLDLYAALNAQDGLPAVTVGDKLELQNKGMLPIYLTATTTPSNDLFEGVRVNTDEYACNDLGDSGAFASSPVGDGIITVKVVV